MRTLMLVLMLGLSSCLGALGVQSSVALVQPVPDAAESQSTDSTRIDAVIEDVAVVSEAPLVLRVEGYYPADCDMPSNYEVERWGNEVRVSIYQVALSETSCYQQRVPYHETLPEYLFADLTPGTYYLDINGYALRARVRDLPPAPPTPLPPPVEPPGPRFVQQVLCVGDRLDIEPESPTELYHHIDVTFQDVTSRRGEVSIRYVRGAITLMSDTSRILAYQPTRRFGLSFEAIREGDVTGSMQVLTESMSPYGYRLIPLVEYRIHVINCQEPPPPKPIPPDWIRSYAVIDSVDVIVQESYPMRLQLHVRGYYGQSCYGELQIDQWRERSHVCVEIYQLVNPMIMCPERMAILDEIIPLEGSFRSGVYTIHVNDYVLVVDL